VNKGIHRFYQPVLHWGLTHPWRAMGVSTLLIVSGFGLVPLIGSSLFADRALQMPTVSRLASRLMRGLAALLTGALLAWLGGLVSYHAVHVLVTLLGVVPMVVVVVFVVVVAVVMVVVRRFMRQSWESSYS
jgi:hypothetical protein